MAAASATLAACNRLIAGFGGVRKAVADLGTGYTVVSPKFSKKADHGRWLGDET